MKVARTFAIATVALAGFAAALPAVAAGRGGAGWHGGGGWHGGPSHAWHGGYAGHGGHWRYRGYGPGPFWGGVGFGLGLGAIGYYGAYGPLWIEQPVWGTVIDEGPVAVVPPPADRIGRAVPAAPRTPDPIFYPKNGQSPEATEQDRRDCNRWATTQPGAMADASIFQRATYACMEGRGYTVR